MDASPPSTRTPAQNFIPTMSGEDSEEDVDSVESPQDREVYMKLSRTQRRNKRRKRSKKIKRDQANTLVTDRSSVLLFCSNRTEQVN